MNAHRRVASQAKRKRPAKGRTPRKRQNAPRAATALVVRAPGPQPWNLTQDEVGLIKNHVAKGATDEELKFCLAVARRRKLDPFKQQIWFVKRRDKSADGGARWVPMTSIDGLLHVAARDHKDFGSSDDPTFGPMKEIKWNYFEKGGKFMAPEWATVAVWKKGATRPTTCTVYWDEIYPDAGASPMVREKPRLMLGKCALAQCTRRAYPDTGGLYIPEEFQGPPEFTPQGREIVVNEAEERYKEREREGLEHLTPAQREVVKKRMEEAERKKQEPIIDVQPPKDGTVGKAKGFEYAEEVTLAVPTDYAGLHYLYVRESQTWRVDGPEALKKANRDILAPLYSRVAGAIVCNAKQLGKLISECERRKVPIRAVGVTREPGEE
jgi:hypothetical protein